MLPRGVSWVDLAVCACAGFFFWLWLRTEMEWADDADRWARERARLVEVDDAEPGCPNLMDAAVAAATRQDQIAFEASVLSDISRLPEVR